MRTLPALLSLGIALAIVPDSPALDPEDIRALVAKPHSRENLLPELEIYPAARAFEVRTTTSAPGVLEHEGDPFTAKEKVVGGEYIVSQFQPAPGAPPIVMVVTFDDDDQLYRKWVMIEGPEPFLGEIIGQLAPSGDAIAWRSVGMPEGVTNFSIETYTDDTVEWVGVTIADGAVVQREHGRAFTVEGDEGGAE